MYRNRSISPSTTLLEALKLMDYIDSKLLILIQNSKYVGLLSIGDIQRAIISKKPFDTQVKDIIRKNNIVASPTQNIEEIKDIMIQFRMEFCPVIDEDNNVVEMYFWEDVLGNEIKPKVKFDIPIVIMAGGLGTRLRPLTNVIPKPLVPIGDKTILETIIDNFIDNGNSNFFISVNYKADLIKYFLKDQNKVQIQFIDEEKPSGTAGSLAKLKNKINETFFVSNCDIIIDQDYFEILDFHRKNKNKLTIVAAIKNYQIEYGTLETGVNGKLIQIQEKPEYTIQINSGMYILEPELLNYIPDNEFYHITQLIEYLMENGESVGVFPVSEGSWKDIGNWDEYLKVFLNK